MTDKLYLATAARASYQPNTHMQTQLVKRLLILSGLALALLGINPRAAAQLSVGPGGLATQAFNSAPPVSQFSTRSVGPVVAGGVIDSPATMDSVVQTNPAASINLVLPTTTNDPKPISGDTRLVQ